MMLLQKTVDPAQTALEVEMAAETELTRLKQQYRIMENDRVVRAEFNKVQLRNQQNMIGRLEFDKAELVLAITAAKASPWVRKDQLDDERLTELLTQRDKLEEYVKTEKLQIAELDRQIGQLAKDITALKRKVPSDVQVRESILRHNRLVYRLENRLEVVTKGLNVIISYNMKLRSEIDSLLKERTRFNGLWNKLIGQLNSGKQVINDLIEQATITFNQRDEQMNKIQALREKATRDMMAHTAEMCELQRTLDNEMKLQEFLGVKGQFRELVDLKAKQQAESRARRKEKQDKIATYTQILNTMKEFTGEHDVNQLAAYFVKQEEENFALFNYVNELNDELESLQMEMAYLTNAIEEARRLHEYREKQQAATLEKISEELQEQTELTDQAEEELLQCSDDLEKMLRGIESLFRAVRCDQAPLLELLGDNSHVTTNNVMLYLTIIEKRIAEMMHKVYWVDKALKQPIRLDEGKKPRLKAPSLTRIAPTQPCALCVEKEKLQIVTEGLEIPMSREEAMSKLKERLEEDYSELLHNVSGCNLPAARMIILRRYQ